MEMVFLGKTMNFVNATHVNGESESIENMNYVVLERRRQAPTFLLLTAHVLLLRILFLMEIFFSLFCCADEAPVLSSPKLACRWKCR